MSSSYCRDSSKYLINSDGQILFSENNFSDTLLRTTRLYEEDTICWITGKMEKNENDINVPAGTFNNTLNLKGTIICNPKYTRIGNPHYVNKYYAPEVGEILHSYLYVYDGSSLEKRLTRYKINK
jgi:hypothetical protein